MENFACWTDAAIFYQETFGSYVNWDEGFFICPACTEPIYEVDWEEHDEWFLCPICETEWDDIL